MSAIDHALGPMGWGNPNITIRENLDIEKAATEKYFADYPRGYMARSQAPIPQVMLDNFNKFQQANNRSPGSLDMTLMTSWVFGKKFWWRHQEIGSCVWSNTFRRVVDRMAFQIALRGDAGEYFGTTEYSPTSIAPSLASYGFARERAKMNGLSERSDGLYRSPMTDSMLKDGFVTCSTPKLVELLRTLGMTKEEHLPEVFGNPHLYRRFGNWEFNKTLLPYADHRLLEAPPITSIEQLLQNCREFKPGLQCSGIAIKKIGTHKDGFSIHAQDRSTSWGHNLGYGGLRVGSDGKEYIIITNDSWIRPNEPDPWRYVYNVPVEEVDRWFRSDMLDSGTIGEIDMPKPMPPM